MDTIMSTYTMYDSAFAPSPGVVDPNTPWAGYLPSPSAYNAWTQAQFHELNSILPIWVAAQGDGLGDAYIAHYYIDGWKLVNAIILDIEEGFWNTPNFDVVKYIGQFISLSNELGHKTILYMNPENFVPYLEQAPSKLQFYVNDNYIPQAIWIATTNYTISANGQLQVPGIPAGLWDTKGQRAVQYLADTTYNGVNVDVSICEDGFGNV